MTYHIHSCCVEPTRRDNKLIGIEEDYVIRRISKTKNNWTIYYYYFGLDKR